MTRLVASVRARAHLSVIGELGTRRPPPSGDVTRLSVARIAARDVGHPGDLVGPTAEAGLIPPALLVRNIDSRGNRVGRSDLVWVASLTSIEDWSLLPCPRSLGLGKEHIVMRSRPVRGAPSLLVAMSALLCACTSSTSTDAAPAGGSNTGESTPTVSSEQGLLDGRTFSPEAGEVQALPLGNYAATMRSGRYALRLSPGPTSEGLFFVAPAPSSTGDAGL